MVTSILVSNFWELEMEQKLIMEKKQFRDTHKFYKET